jgi:putative chitinase
MLITKEQLKQIATTLSDERAAYMADLLNEICPKYGIDTLDKFHEFLANVVQESGEFSHKVENMNYSANRLLAVWPSRFKNLFEAQKYARKPVELSNFVYGGRMGNNQPNDGWDFRGGGFIGLTGREVYTKYGNYIGKDPVEAANLVRTEDYYALDSAAWFFSVLKGLNDEAERDEWRKVVKSINGGFIGMDVRTKYYERIKKIIPDNI